MVVAKFNNVNGKALEQLYKALFNFLLVEGIMESKMMATRSSAFLLFAELVKRLNKLPEITAALAYRNLGWRTSKSSDWHISCDELQAKAREYVGLVNMGATCYVNAIVQQLFMMPEFRNEVLQLKEKLEKGTPLYELQSLMGVLYQRKLASVKAKKFYEAMKIDVHVQRDTSEFLTELFEAVTAGLRRTNKSRLIKHLFEIGTSTTVCCLNCNEVSGMPATTLMLGLPVKVNKSLSEGLEAFVSPEILEGENSYSCDKCRKKVTAKKQERIESLPKFLLIHLKRFEQAYGVQNKKLNSYYEFPLFLDMHKYVHEQHCLYNLKGVVIHVGALNVGHYYSLIRNNNTWIRFDDTAIEPFDIADLELEAFGYEAEGAEENSRNAYILIYEQRALAETKGAQTYTATPTSNSKVILIEEASKDTVTLSDNLRLILLEEHRDFVERQLMFTPGFDSFIISLMKCKDFGKAVSEFGLKYLLTSLARSSMKNSIFEITKEIETRCTDVAPSVVSLFSVREILHEFVLGCPKAEARLCVFAILKTSINIVYDSESKALERYFAKKEVDRIPSLIYLMNSLIREFGNINKNNCGEYFRTLSELLKPQLLKLLKGSALIGKTLTFLDIPVEMDWKGDASLQLEELKSEQLIAVWEDCGLKGEKVSEKLFARQIPHAVNFLTELIKAYMSLEEEERPIDYIEIEKLLKETNMKLLCAMCSETEEGQIAIAELFTQLFRANNAKQIMNSLARLNSFDTKELPAALRIVEFLLGAVDDEAFKRIVDIFKKVILVELKVNAKEYFTVVCYIDSFFKVLSIHNKRFEALSDHYTNKDSKTEDVVANINLWLKENEDVSKAKSLFRNSKGAIGSKNTELVSISAQAGLERRELMQGLLNHSFKNWNEFEYLRTDVLESVKPGSIVDIYLYITALIHRSEERRWIKAEVIGRSALALKVQLDKETWIESSLEKLAPENAKTQNARSQERTLLFKLYLELN